MSVVLKYIDVMPYLIAGDQKIEEVMRKALQIKTCEFMFQEGQPLGRKYTDYRAAKLAEGCSVGEVVVGFVSELDGDERILSNSSSVIGDKNIVMDYLCAKENVKRVGSVIADNKKETKQVGVLATRVANTIDGLSFYGDKFRFPNPTSARCDVVQTLKNDETSHWTKCNKMEDLISDVVVSKYCANTSGDIARNMGVGDNILTETYSRFANEMNDEYEKMSENNGVEFQDAPAMIEEKKANSGLATDKWVTYGELHPQEPSTSKLQKKLKQYNVKAIIKWLEKLLDSINSIPVKVSTSGKEM